MKYCWKCGAPQGGIKKSKKKKWEPASCIRHGVCPASTCKICYPELKKI